MAESCPDFVDCDRGVGPHCARETGLGSDGCTHAVFTHMTTAFLEAPGTAEDTTGAPVNSSATNRDVCGRWSGEGGVVGDVDGAGPFEAERLEHAFMVIDG